MRYRLLCLLSVACLLFVVTVADAQSQSTVFATGLNNPRGLKFGPDGSLYVAEGGTGGALSTVGKCEQVDKVGPYSGGFTARISKVDSTGRVTTVVDKLPSSQTNQESGGLVSGVADVAFVGDDLYALLAGAGCSHGLEHTSNGVIRVDKYGHWRMVANLSEFLRKHPVANPDLTDLEPDGTWYSMISLRGRLYATEPNHQEIVSTSPWGGDVHRIFDVSATSPTWIGPTALAHQGNSFYLGNLGPFPIIPGSENLYQLKHDDLSTVAMGLTTVLGLAGDNHGGFYILESMTAAGLPDSSQLGTGQVVHLDATGVLTTIATGLSFPSALTLGPDGNLYVSNFGFASAPGSGQILRINPNEVSCIQQLGLISWWKGENNAEDAVGNYNGTIVGNVTFAPGEVGQAFVFDGTSYVNMGAVKNTQLDVGGSNFTVEFWLKTASNLPGGGVGQFVVGDAGMGQAAGFRVLYLPTLNHQLRFRIANATTASILDTPPVNDGLWHHFAFVRSGTTLLAYEDGLQVGSTTTAIANIASPSEFHIGGRTSDSYFVGSMDEVSVYGRALSAAEITSIFDAGPIGKCP